MKFATRINSFLKRKEQTIASAMEEIGNIDGLTHVDLNYPEHMADTSESEMLALLERNGLHLNGIALRFQDIFQDGEFTNHDPVLAQQAERLCLEAVGLCRRLGGEIVTVWQAFDGFDYPFQVEYEKAWNQMKNAIARIADAAAPDIRVSIEYKPFQPRAFSLVPNMATALLLVEEVGRSNVGLTLDFCHMLMAGENPATALAITAAHHRLYGIHLNDGYRLNDDGLMVGSVHLLQTLEFLYYAKKYNYQQTVYFDTFPVREDSAKECIQNIQTVNRLSEFIDRQGMDHFEKMIQKQSGFTSSCIMGELMK